MSTYKDNLTAAMTAMGTDPRSRFIGYGVREPSRGGGTFAGVAKEQCVETPVAENLMVGLAIGMALTGLKPLVYIERADFMLNALDAIVNHLDAMKRISRGEFEPAVILRIVVGNSQKPLYTGPTHTRDFAHALSCMVSFPVVSITKEESIAEHYAKAFSSHQSTALFEFKDLL